MNTVIVRSTRRPNSSMLCLYQPADAVSINRYHKARRSIPLSSYQGAFFNHSYLKTLYLH